MEEVVFKSHYTEKLYNFDREADFINNESKYFDKYKFTFYYDNNHWQLLDIEKK